MVVSLTDPLGVVEIATWRRNAFRTTLQASCRSQGTKTGDVRRMQKSGGIGVKKDATVRIGWELAIKLQASFNIV